MSGNIWWSTKAGAIFSSDIPLDFLESIQVVPLKYITFFLAGLNAK